MAAPLDAERARLRALGLTEAEVSQVLINQASGLGSPPSAAGGAVPVQGNMTGVLGNASAVLSHARGAIPTFKADLGNLSNNTAPAKSRGISALKLAGVAVIVAVLGFAVYQEWQQHIISNTEIAHNNAVTSKQEAAGKSIAGDMNTGKITNDGFGHAIHQGSVNDVSSPTCKLGAGSSYIRKECINNWAGYYGDLKDHGIARPSNVPVGSIAHQDTAGKVTWQNPVGSQ